MKLNIYMKWVLLLSLILVLMYFMWFYNLREGLASGDSKSPGDPKTPGDPNTPGDSKSPGDPNTSGDSKTLCETLDSQGTLSDAEIDKFSKYFDEETLKDGDTKNAQQIAYGIKNLLPVYKGAFIDLTKRICAIQKRIKKIKTQIPKTIADIIVKEKGVISVDYDRAETDAFIRLDIIEKGSTTDNNYGQWQISAALPMGPTGDQGLRGDPGLDGPPGPPGPQGPQGRRGNWDKTPIESSNDNVNFIGNDQSNLQFSMY